MYVWCIYLCVSWMSVEFFLLAIVFTVVQCNVTTQQRAAQQSRSSKLCLISGRQARTKAETASQAPPVGLKLHAVLCCLETFCDLN